MLRIIMTALCTLGLSASVPAADDASIRALQLGAEAQQRGDLEEAERIFARECPAPLLNTDVVSVVRGICLSDRALLMQSRSDFEGAEVHYRQALDVWSKLPDAPLDYRASTLTNLGGLYGLEG